MQLGVATVGQLAALPKAALEAAFGEARGGALAALAAGQSHEEARRSALPSPSSLLALHTQFRRQAPHSGEGAAAAGDAGDR